MSNDTTSSSNPQIWKDIPGYEGYYKISSDGLVKRIKPSNRNRGGILTATFDSKRYLQIKLTVNGNSKTFKVHKLVMIAFAGDRPAGFQINHKNGIKTDNRIENLEYVSPRQNMYHSYGVLSRQAVIGEASVNAKLTDENVRDIRRAFADGGITYTQLARLYNVSRYTISSVIKRLAWKHVL